MKVIRELASWIVPVIIGIIIAFGIKAFVLSPVRVDGPSMEPNLVNNERIWMFKQAKVKHLSVIVFDAHGEDPSAKKGSDYVKRVIGLPGDSVAFKNNNIYVNNKKIDQSFISRSEATTGTGATSWTLTTLAKRYGWQTSGNVVPKGKYFVLGDHRSVSNDSRYWGYVDANKVAGVVKVPFWTGTKTQRHNINSLSYD
ncbi:signal peptidase I [Secundilactobacillus kimchicus]|uniref:Signal peptidase I n=1 Tax=Secundilactobacillus kimchicus JCM 15530 TaxID=1302272 RepID=A0A0R1HYN1_9LACO|nr:signal peptidase I [Secundilactobacillus kimchicus]KRK48554.1 signal peptidase I [Secundilactobacillus kimchicus JCM 15530]MBT9671301.1 signal peptidase I [Secundilactobacillus kimchicus]